MTLLLVMLFFAEGQKNAVPGTAERFDQVSKQAVQARDSNHPEQAIRLYREAVHLRPNWKDGWWSLGNLLYDSDRYQEGRAAFRRFTSLEPKLAQGWAMLGLCEYGIKAYDAALADLEQARALGLQGNAEIQAVSEYHAALLLTRAGRFEAATEILMRFAARGEEKPALVEAAGVAALRKPLLPAEVPEADRELVAQVGRAVMDTGARREAEALKEFEHLAANYPNVPSLHYLYGSLLLLSDPDRGLRELSTELEISPLHVPALLQIAFEYLKRGDGAAALPYAKKAAEIDSQSFVAHNALGRALVESGDLDNGIRELEISKKQVPDNAQTRIALASAYAKAGRREEAERERAEFVRLQQLAKKPGEQ